MEADMKKLRANRGYIKASFSRQIKYIEDKDSLSQASSPLLKVKLEKLEKTFNDYESVNMLIFAINSKDEEDIEAMEQTYINGIASLRECIESKKEKDYKSPKPNIKLPEIHIKPFTGRYCDFKPFMELFMSMIHNNSALDNIQKMYYLRSHLKDEPYDLIKNLTLTKDSYDEALRLLNHRYDKKYLIMFDHINTILDLPAITKSTAIQLREFVSLVRQEIAALNNLCNGVSSWGPLLICVLSRKLDQYTARSYQMERDDSVDPTVEDLLQYLERKAVALETTDQGIVKKKAVVNVSTTKSPVGCLYCKLTIHKLYNCPQFKCLSINDRLEFVKKHNVCSICLNEHPGKCRYHFRCSACKKQHNTLLHKSNDTVDNTFSCNISHNNTQVLLPTVRIKILARDGTYVHVKALLDSGSQASFATKALINSLGLQPTQMQSEIMGIGRAKTNINYCIPLNVISVTTGFAINVNCNVVEHITCKLPQNKLDLKDFKHFLDLQLADSQLNIPSDVHLLMGANIFFQVILPTPQVDIQPVLHETPALNAIPTKFGYIVGGTVSQQYAANNIVTLHCNFCDSQLNNTLEEFWKTESVPQTFFETNSEHEQCEIVFKNSVELSNNRFSLDLPLKIPLEDVNATLGNSFDIAFKRFLSLEKKLHSDGSFSDYKKFLQDFISLGHAHYVDLSSFDFNKDPLYFLAHFPVYKNNSKTNKVRSVFDGSGKTSKGISLNDLLLNGPVVQRDLFEIIILFRLGTYTIIGDIKHMFRNIKMKPNFTSLQNILWRDHPDESISCIQLDTVTYGLKSSSYLATRCLKELTIRFGSDFPLAAFILNNCCYVDDFLYASNDINSVINAKDQLRQLLSLGGFETHKWTSNDPDIISDVPTCEQHFDDIELQQEHVSYKALGLNVSIKDDSFKISSPIMFDETLKITKRSILSYICKFYDPIGYAAPIVVKAKVILQKLWLAKIDWNDIPPDDIKTEWLQFVTDLNNMKPIYFNRNIDVKQAVSVQLIGFADASTSVAYGCCIYLRVVYLSGKVLLYLLCAKSRINPLSKPLTIPRLELNACLLLSKLIVKVYNVLQIKIDISNIYLFTDSKIVLSWLQSDTMKLEAYVANRVKVICQNTLNFHWLYISTQDNPADLVSRGVSPSDLCESKLWWQGPVLLQDNTYEFESSFVPKISAHTTGNVTVSMSVQVTSDTFEYLHKFSSINKMTRVLAYIVRFCNNCRSKDNKNQVLFLSYKELHHALMLLIKYDQSVNFAEEISLLKNNKVIKGSLKSLNPFLDKNGMLRVGGRLQNADISYSQKHPLILPKDSHCTQLIIRNEHYILLHAGPKLVMSSLNERYCTELLMALGESQRHCYVLVFIVYVIQYLYMYIICWRCHNGRCLEFY